MTPGVRIGLGHEPQSLFPGRDNSRAAGDILAPLLLASVQYDGQLSRPRLLARMPTNRDRTITTHNMHITYRWQRGYRWHDGVQVQASDAVWAWEMGLEGDPRITGMRAPGPLSLVVTWGTKTATMDHNYLTLPRHLFQVGSDRQQEFGRSPLGNGPYRFVSWEPQDRIELVRVPRFREGAARLDQLLFRFIPPSSLGQALLAGKSMWWAAEVFPPSRGSN